MAIYSAEHRRLIQMFEPDRHQEYSEVLASLGRFMEKEILPVSPKLVRGEISIKGPRKALYEHGMPQMPIPKE